MDDVIQRSLQLLNTNSLTIVRCTSKKWLSMVTNIAKSRSPRPDLYNHRAICDRNIYAFVGDYYLFYTHTHRYYPLYASIGGNHEIINKILTTHNRILLFRGAALRGNVELMHTLGNQIRPEQLLNGEYFERNLYAKYACVKQLMTIEYLITRGYKNMRYILALACYADNDHYIKYAIDNGAVYTKKAFIGACMSGNSDRVNKLMITNTIRNRYDGYRKRMYLEALELCLIYGRLEVANVLCIAKLPCPPAYWIFARAASEAIEWYCYTFGGVNWSDAFYGLCHRSVASYISFAITTGDERTIDELIVSYKYDITYILEIITKHASIDVTNGLYVCLQARNDELAIKLIERGACLIQACLNYHTPASHYVLISLVERGVKSADDILLLACQINDPKLAKIIISCGAKVTDEHISACKQHYAARVLNLLYKLNYEVSWFDKSLLFVQELIWH